MTSRIKLRETDAPYQQLIGWQYTEAENGCSRCVLEIRDELLNSRQAMRSAHGGAIYSLADGTMGGALYSVLDADEWGTTVDMHIVYFKAVTAGTFSCNARIVHRGDKLATLEAEITHEDNLVARAIGTWRIFRIRPDGS